MERMNRASVLALVMVLGCGATLMAANYHSPPGELQPAELGLAMRGAVMPAGLDTPAMAAIAERVSELLGVGWIACIDPVDASMPKKTSLSGRAREKRWRAWNC